MSNNPGPLIDAPTRGLILNIVHYIAVTILASQLIQGCNEYNRLSFPKVETKE